MNKIFDLTKRNFTSTRALSGLVLATATLCDEVALAEYEQSQIEVSYFRYQDYQTNSSRMSVDAPMIYYSAPVGEDFKVYGSFVVDNISGASPLYHDTLSGDDRYNLSGASPRIEDQRVAGNINFGARFEDLEVIVGLEGSDEDDYTARGFNFQTNFWTSDKNLVINLGASASFDDINASNSSNGGERDTYAVNAGFTQIINPKTLWQFSANYQTSDGYHSDPYKSFDFRPESRNAFSVLNRLAYFWESLNSGITFDHRLFSDSWGIYSHAFEVALATKVSENVMIKPYARYYLQSESDFYSDLYPPQSGGGFYSADQRLAAFGSLSGGLKADYAFDLFNLYIISELTYQDNALADGSYEPESEFYSFFVGSGLISTW